MRGTLCLANWYVSLPSISHRRACQLALLLVVSLSPQFAQAETCASLQRQMRAAAQQSNSAASPLLRQLSAIRALERQRQCSSETARSGVFNACRDLAQRRSAVERQIAASPSGGGRDLSALRARMRALQCSTAARSRAERTERRSVSRPSSKSSASSRSSSKSSASSRSSSRGSAPRFSSSGTLLFCVRLADGYYFPAPNSQFVGTDQVENTADRCRFICESEAMDVYVLREPSLETPEMISTTTGKPYKDLPAAFRYREKATFNRCNFARYHQYARLLRAQSATVSSMKDVVLPLPMRRPILPAATSSGSAVDPQTVSSVADDATLPPNRTGAPAQVDKE